jgi:hypothetical protein
MGVLLQCEDDALVQNNAFWNYGDGGRSYIDGHDYTVTAGSNAVFNQYVTPDGGPYPGDEALWMVNPQFADMVEFRLQPESPLIDAGLDVDNDHDYDGNPRPAGGGFDVGAYER